MRNPTGKKLEKIIFKLFDDASQGVDRYNHNDSLWLIFTNEMRWVVEYTKDQTLWYNYNFFKEEMELIGLNCVEDKDLIKKWFESRFLGIPKVEDVFEPFFDQDQYVEDIIQNGVKDIRRTRLINLSANQMVEEAIQNGVRHTRPEKILKKKKVEDTIQNGVRHTAPDASTIVYAVEDAIQDKEKDTQLLPIEQSVYVENIIKNGVKHTEDGDWLDGDERFNNIIQNGVKETYNDCSNNIARVEGIVRIGEKIN